MLWKGRFLFVGVYVCESGFQAAVLFQCGLYSQGLGTYIGMKDVCV